MGKSVNLLLLMAFAVGVTSCGSPSDDIYIPIPRLIEKGGDEVLKRKALYCSADKVSLAFLNEDRQFIHTPQFVSFFDCANYDYSFQGLEPLFHSTGVPGFIEGLMESVNGLTGSKGMKDIRAALTPWFAEHADTGVSKIDHILPIMADVIKNEVFRKGLKVLGVFLAHGQPIWHTALKPLSRLIYDARYPDLYEDLRKLFNIRKVDTTINHLAITTREFFRFLQGTNETISGQRTNAWMLLELMDELPDWKVPEHGFLSLYEYANNRDIFSALYQEAGGRMRGEKMVAGLADNVATRRGNAYAMFEGGESAPLLELIHLVHTFNQPLPKFMPKIQAWFAKKKNQKRMHEGLFDYFAERLIGEIIVELNIKEIAEKYIESEMDGMIIVRMPGPEAAGNSMEEECYDLLYCATDKAGFITFWKNLVQSEYFAEEFETILDYKNRDRFSNHNSNLLQTHGGLAKDLIALYRSEELVAYIEKIFPNIVHEVDEPVSFEMAFTTFDEAHKLEEGEEYEGIPGASFQRGPGATSKLFYEHMVSSWLINTKLAWGESLIVSETFSVIVKVLDEFVDSIKKDEDKGRTLSHWFFRATYSDPSLMEHLVKKMRKLGLDETLNENIEWLQTEIADEIFDGSPDEKAAFVQAMGQLPNYIEFVASGLARSGHNLSRVLSERDGGYLIGSWVNVISKAYSEQWILRLLPTWLDFIHFLDIREDRMNEAYDRQQAGMDQKAKYLEDLREARRQFDGVTAMRSIFKQLFRPKVEDDWDTSLAGEILLPLSELAKFAEREKTEDFLLTISLDMVKATDDEIEAAYEFISPKRKNEFPTDDEIEEERQFRRTFANLMAHESFPKVLTSLDQLFKDQAVMPALDSFRDKVHSGELNRLLVFVRKVMGIPGVN